jgi:D-threonine aldolase
MIEYGDYKVNAPDSLETPAMLVFESQVDHNISSVCELVGGGQNLMVHVKTHKSVDIARKQVAAGVAGFKCATLKELEMALEAGGKENILTYPLVQRGKAERFAKAAAADAFVAAIVSAEAHVDLLAQVAADKKQKLAVMLDLDVGMHRTGVAPGPAAMALYRRIDTDPNLEAAGLHIYDGQDHVEEQGARRAAAQVHIDAVRAFKAELEAQGMAVDRMVGGGSFSFAYYAGAEGMQGSPGTGIYWDAGYAAMLPDMPFKWAALVLAQVVDRYPQQRTFTTELGHKAVSGDVPLERRARLLGLETAQLVGQNEEHGVFRLDEGELPQIGTYLLAVPGHVCPTTIRYPGSYVIDADGEVVDYYPHTARDRQ